jgi:hypothetical protein
VQQTGEKAGKLVDPRTLIRTVMRTLTADGYEPVIRSSELRNAEQASRELLLCLGIEPARVGGEIATSTVYSRDDPDPRPIPPHDGWHVGRRR